VAYSLAQVSGLKSHLRQMQSKRLYSPSILMCSLSISFIHVISFSSGVEQGVFVHLSICNMAEKAYLRRLYRKSQ